MSTEDSPICLRIAHKSADWLTKKFRDWGTVYTQPSRRSFSSRSALHLAYTVFFVAVLTYRLRDRITFVKVRIVIEVASLR